MARPTSTARRYERIADWLIFAVLFFVLAASFKTSEVLTVGDWDMWVDWKDREWWPLLYPLRALPSQSVKSVFLFLSPTATLTFALAGLWCQMGT